MNQRSIHRLPELDGLGGLAILMVMFFLIALVLIDVITAGYEHNIKAWLIFVGLTFFVTIMASLLTWHLLENPILKLKKIF